MINNTRKETLLLVDGNALVHRGFHAIPYLSTNSGEPTNGVYGFAALFLNALKVLKPDYVAVSFDLPEPTFRDKLYEGYKAKRIAAPDELYQQIPRVKELVSAFNVPIFERSGFEADDIIGTLARLADKQGLGAVILTGDFDPLQLVNQNIKVYAPKKGLIETQLYGEKEVFQKYGLRPDQLIDYKALRGDPSDNIPGVRGVGDKTAVDLLTKFGDFGSLYEFLKECPEGGKKIKPRIAKLLLDYKEDAILSKKLASIVCDVPVKLDLKKAVLADFDEERVVRIFHELEFTSLLNKIPKSNGFKKAQREPRKAGNYRLVDSSKKLSDFTKILQKQKIIALDTEATSERPTEAELVGLGVSWMANEAWYLPKKYIFDSRITSILSSPKVRKIGHNIKYDILVLRQAGIKLRGELFDTMVAAYLLNPGARTLSLDTLAFVELGYRMQTIEELIGAGKNQVSIATVAPERVAWYCGEDVDFTWRLKEKLEAALVKKNLLRLFHEIEMPLVWVLVEMEYRGIKLDKEVLRKLSSEAGAEIKKTEQKIYSTVGQQFNIGSPIQLKDILFNKLNISTEGLKKGKTGYSTAATELEKLRALHPAIGLISDWREVSKLKNTYLDTLPKLVNPSTARLHTSFNQTIAATGRLSSSDPNLQNIPVRTLFGRKIRGAFIAETKFSLLSLDYSQIELRLAAHLSGDKKMLKVFQENGDIHTATAMEIFEVGEPGRVTLDQRRKAKVINFGVLYGLSAYGLTSRIPEVSRAEAKLFIEKYKLAYPSLVEYLESVIENTRRSGFVKNELGRMRILPEITSSQYQVRSAAERAAINMPLQSLAADIIKMAMNKLYEEGLVGNPECRLLLQVHDELLFETLEERSIELAKNIANIMEGIYKLKIPLLVEAKIGKNWEEMQKLEF